jgi:uncharacterized coiled-coil protein SlyX
MGRAVHRDVAVAESEADAVIRMHALALIDMEARIRPLGQSIAALELTIAALEQTIAAQQREIGIYRRSRAVRLATALRYGPFNRHWWFVRGPKV